jgi:hypothetical protein
MKKNLIVLICLVFFDAFSQTLSVTGKYEQSFFENGAVKTSIFTNPLINKGENKMVNEKPSFTDHSIYSSAIRWSFSEPTGIANNMTISGDGLVGYCGWYLNNKRISAYGNTNSTPYWDFSTPSLSTYNYICASDTGIVAAGSYQNIYLFDKNSSTPFLNFDLTTLPDTGNAGPVGITSNGAYLIGTASRSDTSTIMGFSKTSSTPIWKFRVIKPIQGVKIAKSDSLAIINTYYNYWVINVYTGAIRYRDTITNGTQTSQGISGNGNYIATINYKGYVNVYQWSGTAYSLLWQYQEVPGTYYNWMSAVDISNDGTYLATGSLIFVTSSSYDGRIRFFKISNGNTPIWSYVGMGDEVTDIHFSKNGKILAACSWGDLSDTAKDFLVFKVPALTNTPIYSLNIPGSPYACGISNDGTSAIVGGKAVHARAMGYGGTYYNIYVDTSDNPLKINNTSSNTPNTYKLGQNYPNPFNPTTKIGFQIKEAGLVTLKVYDVLGKEVATLVNEKLQAGEYEVPFSVGQNSLLQSGVYFYRLQTNGFTDTKKLVLVK